MRFVHRTVDFDLPPINGAQSHAGCPMSVTGLVRRMDADSMTRKDAYRETLQAFRSGKIDILVGTQMIAKGLHFPNVTLVGIINADLALHLPDFRAGERTFQLLTQVAGRAGRKKPGRMPLRRPKSIRFRRHREQRKVRKSRGRATRSY